MRFQEVYGSMQRTNPTLTELKMRVEGTQSFDNRVMKNVSFPPLEFLRTANFVFCSLIYSKCSKDCVIHTKLSVFVK